MLSNTEIVEDVAVLPQLPKCQHYPVVLDLYIEVNDDSNCISVRLWNKRNYAAMKEELEIINGESMFDGQTIDKCYGTFLNVTNNPPLTTREEKVVSACKFRPPRSLMKRRSDAWKKFVKARKDYGRNSDLTALARRDYSSINIEYHNFSISRQCETEANLICNQSNKPKLFHKKHTS